MGEEREKALLVGVDTGEELDFDRSIKELKSLAEACEMDVAGVITQRMPEVNKAFYVGTGKVAEIREYALTCEAQVVVFDNALFPSQIRNLQEELDLPILDRVTLILDIFAIRAQTREAKLQVETARLQYLLPRLVGMHAALSRQGGASGSMSNRGAGEKKLELDRRRIEHRISELKKELDMVERDRRTQRKRRMNSRIPQVALVGYTNAGKSTVMNQMVEHFGGREDKKVLEKDMLFATLETSVRYIEAGEKTPFYLVDTVGFIHKLPHGLVKAFHSTLEEVRYADLLVQVVDFSDPQFRQQMEVTAETLRELDAGDIPMVYVYNKADLCDMKLPKVKDHQIYMAAADGVGIEELVQLITEQVYAGREEAEFVIPYSEGAVTSYLMEHGKVMCTEYEDCGIRMRIACDKRDTEKYRKYLAQ